MQTEKEAQILEIKNDIFEELKEWQGFLEEDINACISRRQSCSCERREQKLESLIKHLAVAKIFTADKNRVFSWLDQYVQEISDWPFAYEGLTHKMFEGGISYAEKLWEDMLKHFAADHNREDLEEFLPHLITVNFLKFIYYSHSLLEN